MTASAESPTAPVRKADTGRSDLKTILYWISLGAAAGGMGGLLVGGIGGRVAMFVLRVTSDDSVRGLESDDGFTIGRFNLLSTLSLLVVAAVLGAIVGLIVIAGRPFFPRRGMPLGWALAGAMAGGAILIHQDGVDFRALEPHLLAVAFFIAIPSIGAGVIAWLTEEYPTFWWRRRKLTAVTAVAGLPIVIAFPVAIVALLVGSCWWLAMRWSRTRRIPDWKPARAAAMVVFALVVALGLYDLSKDVPAIV